jgi:hypothetical protein
MNMKESHQIAGDQTTFSDLTGSRRVFTVPTPMLLGSDC